MNKQEKIDNLDSKDTLELSQTAQDEKKVLEFWEKHNIFHKSIEQRKNQKEFVFYDGPPFATGSPHPGHILAGTIKDILPRYKSMKGFFVERKWGWDCHGLPIENIIEKKFKLNSKKDIEDFGVKNFNKEAKNSVLSDDQIWRNIVPKSGRWVDMSNPYKTMDSDYTESLWWAFSQLSKKDLISKGFQTMHVCPRCETTLSNNEVMDGYKNIKDLSVTAKFELVDEKNTFVLAWTTTPWTLPGNVSLAVGKDIKYVKAKNTTNKEQYIFAKELFEKIQKEAGFDLEIVKEFKGSELIGKSYIPLFDYYSKNQELENKENGWKIYDADFVTTEAGTGIVHSAPAFGEDDLKLGKKKNLPWIQHVKMNGEFKKEVLDFSGMLVRKKDFPEESDIEIIKNLASQGKLFFKEKYEHSYPHCWRCKTPLLNYATSSWFINTPKIKEKLLSENKKINWIPKHIGEKRFHNWLDNTRDWAVSRSRYWGAPIPIWENKETGDYKVLGSLDELKDKTRSKNSFVLFRHGQSEANIANIISFETGKFGDKLTLEGREKAKKEAHNIFKSFKEGKNENNGKIDIIIASPLIRTTETARILQEELNVSGDIIFDDRIREVNFGKDKNGTSNDNITDILSNENFTFDTKFYDGESHADIKKRMMDFFYDIDKKYKGKNIVVVSHHLPTAISLFFQNNNKGFKKSDIKSSTPYISDIKNSTPYIMDFAPIPHDDNYDLNYHKPYIDQISFTEDEKEYKFIGDVFDCWFESGSMPFASKHYPFENTDVFNPEKGIGFPADFIAEGQDQTRGWFNTLLVLSVALFEKSSYSNVIVNGIILAGDGKKMSKSESNFPGLDFLFAKYGADAIRLYMIASPAVRSESMLFLEKGVDEVMKKVVMKTKNIVAFYELYRDTVVEDKNPINSNNILDQWILEKTKFLLSNVENALEEYRLDDAAKPFVEFIDEFSTWFIRRSRDRFKGDDIEDRDFSIATTRKVLRIFAKIIAPITPFLADHVWEKVRKDNEKISVHLEDWPDIKSSFTQIKVKSDVIEIMNSIREIVSVGLEARTTAGLKVRQPLHSVLVIGANKKIDQKYADIIKDELNIKEIFFEKNHDYAIKSNHAEFSDDLKSISKTEKKVSVILNKNISSELKKEGEYREFLRQVQIMRKECGLQVSDTIELKIDLNKNKDSFIEDFKQDLEKTAGVKSINYSEISGGDFIKINNKEIKIVLIEI